MGVDPRRLRLDEITQKIIGRVHDVRNALGSGFLEKVYKNSLSLELRLAGLAVAQQKRIEVSYRDVVVGEFVADLLVDDSVLVEVRAVRALDDVYTAQCMNYLKATGLQVCLLVNFGTPRATVKRVVLGF
jgi:GxxExxY protein